MTSKGKRWTLKGLMRNRKGRRGRKERQSYIFTYAPNKCKIPDSGRVEIRGHRVVLHHSRSWFKSVDILCVRYTRPPPHLLSRPPPQTWKTPQLHVCITPSSVVQFFMHGISFSRPPPVHFDFWFIKSLTDGYEPKSTIQWNMNIS